MAEIWCLAGDFPVGFRGPREVRSDVMRTASRMMDKYDQVVQNGSSAYVADVRQVWTREGRVSGIVRLYDGKKTRVAYVRNGVWRQESS